MESPTILGMKHMEHETINKFSLFFCLHKLLWSQAAVKRDAGYLQSWKMAVLVTGVSSGDCNITSVQ